MSVNISELANFIWNVADLLRGDYKQSDYGKVILPLTVLRRLDCVLTDSKEKVLNRYEGLKGHKIEEAELDVILNKTAGYRFHNRSKYDFKKLIADPEHITANLRNYINGFSANARDTLEHFAFETQINKLEEADLLYIVVKSFQEFDLHTDRVSNTEMGYLFEELIRKFAEASNETAGEHFTPREVIRLMVNLLFMNDSETLTKEGIVKTLYDPACGTGGMLSIAEEYLEQLNSGARLELFGQEINPESYAICMSEMLIKGQDPDHIKFGDTLKNDQLSSEKFDYMLSNPPFGVDWTKSAKTVKKEYEEDGFGGRFGPGLPRISDGAFLFLLHMMSKMKPSNGGSRVGIVFNVSPLCTGKAGSGENEIRKWVIENDMLEAIIALPDQIFYNTGIATYLWIVTNRKEPDRKGKIQLINAVSFFENMRKSLGEKRHEISDDQIKEIVTIYGEFSEGTYSKIFENDDFGYMQITIERPLRDKKGKIATDSKGKPKPDSSLRETERITLKDDIQQFFKREVLPYVPDAWLEQSSKKVGYEINFTKYFYEYKPLRHLKEIKHDIFRLEKTRQNINSAITKGTDPKVKMKESGIQWVGKIPKHWKIAPLFTKLFQQKKINEGFLERNVLSLSYGKIVKRDINTNFGLLPKSFGTYQIVDPEDIILRLTDLQNDKKSLRVGYVGQRGIITSAYLCLKAIGIYPRYAYLLLHHYDIMKVFYNFGAGVRQSMSFDDLRRFPLVLPPISEQKKIVSYIDHKILQVDKAIQSFNEEVEILKEYRKSLVSTVVTGKANTDDFKD